MGDPYQPPGAQGEGRGAHAGRYAPCPSCAQSDAEPVSFTWWGGLLGPKILTHVKCQGCGTAYNGNSGQLNTTGIVIYSLVALAVFGGVAIVIFGGAFAFAVAR